MKENAKNIEGLKFKYEPEVLRHFTAKLQPKSDAEVPESAADVLIHRLKEYEEFYETIQVSINRKITNFVP